MNSRKALSYIIENAIDDLDIIFDDEIQSALKIVVKDLEILELLKAKHVDIAELKEDGNVIIYNLSMMKQDLLTEEEFKTLKEWLENDK